MKRIAGVDEAGRGPLAGPVVVAACILPLGFDLEGLGDSKKLTEKTRLDLEERIRATCTFAVERAEPKEIDRLNILWATMAAMERAVAQLGDVDEALIDGDRVPGALLGKGRAIVKGDALEPCISAASILAKNERDRIMRAYGEEFPGYGFEEHFGYPTPEHFAALKALGPCPIHRRSFRPVQEAAYCLTLDL